MKVDKTNSKIVNWIKGLVQGDAQSFDLIYHHYAHRIFGISRSKFHLSVEDSEEIVQDVFVKLWKNRAGIDPDRSIEDYLITICKNTVLNLIRKRSTQLHYVQNLAENESHDLNDIENKFNYQEMIGKLEHILSKLSNQRRKVFTMIKIEGYNASEVSEKLNLSKRTIEHHLYHAGKFIKEHLDISIQVFLSMILFF